MEAQKIELLTLLKQEYQDYCLIPEREHQQKRDKKHFIKGLMTASRAVGISYDELNEIIESNPKAQFRDLDEKLSIPTFVRHEIKIEF